MEKEEKIKDCCQGFCSEKMVCKHKHNHCGANSSAIYGLGVIGALFYFLQNAPTFGAVMVGIAKAVFWPAIIMFKLLTYLQM